VCSRISNIAVACVENSATETPGYLRSESLNNLIEQDHRAIKRRCASMGGFKSFRSAAITLTGIELAYRIRKRQFSLGRGRYRNFGSLKQIWDRALAKT
jgi:transposase-like protein